MIDKSWREKPTKTYTLTVIYKEYPRGIRSLEIKSLGKEDEKLTKKIKKWIAENYLHELLANDR